MIPYRSQEQLIISICHNSNKAWVWRWDAAAGGAGADWVTCLHLLERAATAADVARDGAASTVASSMRMRGVSLRSGRHRRDKKSKKNVFVLWPPTGNSNTTTNQTHAHDAGGKCEEVRPVRSAGGA